LCGVDGIDVIVVRFLIFTVYMRELLNRTEENRTEQQSRLVSCMVCTVLYSNDRHRIDMICHVVSFKLSLLLLLVCFRSSSSPTTIGTFNLDVRGHVFHIFY